MLTHKLLIMCDLLPISDWRVWFPLGLLINLLMDLTDAHMHKERCDVDTQTTTTPSYRESLGAIQFFLKS